MINAATDGFVMLAFASTTIPEAAVANLHQNATVWPASVAVAQAVLMTLSAGTA
jgi:hypothetical protein